MGLGMLFGFVAFYDPATPWLDNKIFDLLCIRHQMLLHNKGWDTIGDDNDRYWLTPPKERDPGQHPIEMPSKNPLVAAMNHTRQTDQQLVS